LGFARLRCCAAGAVGVAAGRRAFGSVVGGGVVAPVIARRFPLSGSPRPSRRAGWGYVVSRYAVKGSTHVPPPNAAIASINGLNLLTMLIVRVRCDSSSIAGILKPICFEPTPGARFVALRELSDNEDATWNSPSGF